VEKVDVDLKNDLCIVRFDPARVSKEQMLAVIDTQGFEGKVVPDSAATP
jgi:hypothetical protein